MDDLTKLVLVVLLVVTGTLVGYNLPHPDPPGCSANEYPVWDNIGEIVCVPSATDTGVHP